MSVLISADEALLLKALASGEVRLRLNRKAYRVKQVISVTSFGMTAVLEQRNGRRSQREFTFADMEVNDADLQCWITAHRDHLDDYLQVLREKAQTVRAQ